MKGSVHFNLWLLVSLAFYLSSCVNEPSGSDFITEDYTLIASFKDVVKSSVFPWVKSGWDSDDNLSVFVLETGITDKFINGRFTNVGDSFFSGKLSILTGEVNDWYALYPYEAALSSLNQSGFGVMIGNAVGSPQEQDGNNSATHLSGPYFPMYGKHSGVQKGSTPNILMQNAFAVVQVHVINRTPYPATVSDIAFTAPEDITGSYYIDYTGESAVFAPVDDNSVSRTVTLKVNNAVALQSGEGADYYFAVKPFTAKAGDIISLSVNGKEMKSTLNKEFSFLPVGYTNLGFSLTISVESITLDKTSLSLYEGDSAIITATVNPDDATDKSVTWSSSDAAIATVDQNGTIKAIKEGTVTITAKAGGKEASCVVEVAKIPVSSITLDKENLTLFIGDDYQLKATVLPRNAFDRSITWSSSNPAIATVDQNGTIKAIKEGTVTITAKAGGKEASCVVEVKIPVSSITLDKNNLTLLVGDEVTLTATVLPNDAFDKSITWKSSNNSVATVENGVVKCVGVGTTTITATAGKVSATCTILVVRDSSAGVYAQYYGGSVSVVNGKIQKGSQLFFGVVNYSSETIRVVSAQLIDGQTGNEGVVSSINADIVPGSYSRWAFEVGPAGIYEPKVKFVYTFKGESYTCSAKYIQYTPSL